jgi:hypothetical protein
MSAWLGSPASGLAEMAHLAKDVHAKRTFDSMLPAADFEKRHDATLGPGACTLLGRRALPDPFGVALHRRLQLPADGGVSALSARAAEHIVLARRSAAPAAAKPR